VTYSRFEKKTVFLLFHFDMSLLLFFIVLAHCLVFRPLWASGFSLLIQRKVTKRKDTQYDRLACSQRCSYVPAGCETRMRSDSHIMKPPAHPVLLG